MQSVNNTLVGSGGAITDASGNIWTITAAGQVAVNGHVDKSTQNVMHLAYADGLVWQENNHNLWWSKASPAQPWAPVAGTHVVPVPMPNAAADDTVLGVPVPGRPAPQLTDASGNTWGIVNGRVAINGVVDTSTANVIELATVSGRIYQENAQHLWWSKATPADPWGPAPGSSVNPVTGGFVIGNASGDQAVINVGVLTVSPEGGSGLPPLSVTRIVTPGVIAIGRELHVSSQTATIEVDGASRIGNGARFTLIGAYRTPRPVYGPIENNGAMTVGASTVQVGALSGRGSVVASRGSSLEVQSAAGGGETIRLESSHLAIGGQGGTYGSAGQPGGMSFLAPIEMDAGSTITLNALHATREVLTTTAGSISEVLLYNGSAEVADLKVHGVPDLYARNIGSGSSIAVLLSTTPSGVDLPKTHHQT